MLCRRPRARFTSVLLILIAALMLSCRSWTLILPPAQPAPVSTLPAPTNAAIPLPAADTPQPPPPATVVAHVAEIAVPQSGAGEPAGCLSAEQQAGLNDRQAMLAYADSLMGLNSSFFKRSMPASWNAHTGDFGWDAYGIVSLSVDDVENKFVVQRMMNALHVAGFVTWLRQSPAQGLHLLALPLLEPAVLDSPWASYIHAYWQNRPALPIQDRTVIPALKLPPCAWMVARGFAPAVDADWWAEDLTGWPDYASAAAAYLAGSSEDAARVALGIDWLGAKFPEGPESMCGPLAWSILHDAGAFPPGWGEWQTGAKTFWLAKPRSNGRPWSLFPKDTFQVYAFPQAMGTFDFSAFPLYPGDFLYTYSERDGFDHMLVVTEMDAAGNVYTVSNITRVEPEQKTTVERVLLVSSNDATAGIARNQWARDKINGRTGHAGFEVFRWKWLEKDITGQPVTYRVQPGDTFGSIAALWKTPAGHIAGYNGMVVDSSLQVGQEVRIPPNAPAGR